MQGRLDEVSQDKCKACRTSPSGYPSCLFVSSLVGSPGAIEALQCTFIDFLLISTVGGLPLATVENKQLTVVTAIDIIPHGMKEDLFKLSKAFSDTAYQQIVERYTRYLHGLRLYVLEEATKLREKAKRQPV